MKRGLIDGAASRKADRKAGAGIDFTDGVDGSAMLFDDPFSKAQSKTNAFHFLVSRRISTIETLEDVRQCFCRDPWSSVADLDPHGVRIELAPNGHVPSRRGVLDCIIENIDENALQPLRIHR